jgi:hypothetical protein
MYILGIFSQTHLVTLHDVPIGNKSSWKRGFSRREGKTELCKMVSARMEGRAVLGNRVARFFLVQTYQNGKSIQMTTNDHKRPYIIPNSHTLCIPKDR